MTRSDARAGWIDEASVRRQTIQATVNADAMIMLALPEDLVQRLGLEELDRPWAISADGRRGEARIGGLLTVWIGDRRTSADCLILPKGADPMVGHLVPSVLDLHPHPQTGTLRPRPESLERPLVRL